MYGPLKHLHKWKLILAAVLRWAWEVARGFVFLLQGYWHHLCCSVYHLWCRFCSVLLFSQWCHIENGSGLHGSRAFVKVSCGWRREMGGGKVIFTYSSLPLPPSAPVLAMHKHFRKDAVCVYAQFRVCVCVCSVLFVWKIDAGLSTCQAASGLAHTEWEVTEGAEAYQ